MSRKNIYQPIYCNMIGVVVLVGLLPILIYCYVIRIFSFWSKRGVKQDSFYSILCMVKQQCLKEISDAEVYEELYAKYPEEKIIGTYCGATPLLILRDPELIKRVLVTNFEYFYSRALHPLDETPEPLLNNLLSCEGDLWKLLRQSLTPTFSSGKIKAMFPLIISRAEKLQQVANEEDNAEIDVKDLMERYATDITGACGFGIDINTLNDEHTTFLQLGRRIFKKTTRDIIVYILKYSMPQWCSFLHLIPPFVEETIKALVKTIMQQRNYKPSGRKDFIDLLLELKNQGKIVGNSLTIKKPDGSPYQVELEFNDSIMISQVLTFFAGGAETTASAVSYMLNELAHHIEYQQKCQEEIDAVLARHDNQLNFEAIKDMKFLDRCLRESLRLFPPLGYLMRKCTKPYTIPDMNITIDPGVLVVIPIKALHMDKQYFRDPERFCPDRFLQENVSTINKHVYLPFGAGPRACIGERLGRMQSLVALAALLRRASVSVARDARRPPPLDPCAALVQKIRGPLPLTLIRRISNIDTQITIIDK